MGAKEIERGLGAARSLDALQRKRQDICQKAGSHYWSPCDTVCVICLRVKNQ